MGNEIHRPACVEMETRLGGTALLVSVAVLAATFGVIALRGQFRGVSASFMGVEGIGRDAAALRPLMYGLLVYAVLQLVGFGVLASTLTEAGERTLAITSLGLWVFGSAAAVTRGVFDGTITVWAGERWADTGAVPDAYDPWFQFSQGTFLFAEVAWLLAAAGFGWAVVRAGVGPSWVGYTAMAWGLFWLLFPVVFRFDLPAVLVLLPIIFGIGMLLA
jgi:hypothetical protein